MPKSSLLKKWVDKNGADTFSKGISPKVNILTRQELEFAYDSVSLKDV